MPNQETKIAEGLAVILAADHARNRPVEIDLAVEGFCDLLASHRDQSRADATRAMRTSKMPKMVRVRMGVQA